ncbi:MULTISPECIES: hypothetical protein [unclassified Sinorhizobium]|uniref:hypothetical protein n=1 Tax=unclassified Sinorhizobium TaxID=2613772 RepID=UPI003524B0BA
MSMGRNQYKVTDSPVHQRTNDAADQEGKDRVQMYQQLAKVVLCLARSFLATQKYRRRRHRGIGNPGATAFCSHFGFFLGLANRLL